MLEQAEPHDPKCDLDCLAKKMFGLNPPSMAKMVLLLSFSVKIAQKVGYGVLRYAGT